MKGEQNMTVYVSKRQSIFSLMKEVGQERN